MNFRASGRIDLPASRTVRETLATDTLHGKGGHFVKSITAVPSDDPAASRPAASGIRPPALFSDR
jgi:hypothetical protein